MKMKNRARNQKIITIAIDINAGYTYRNLTRNFDCSISTIERKRKKPFINYPDKSTQNEKRLHYKYKTRNSVMQKII